MFEVFLRAMHVRVKIIEFYTFAFGYGLIVVGFVMTSLIQSDDRNSQNFYI